MVTNQFSELAKTVCLDFLRDEVNRSIELTLKLHSNYSFILDQTITLMADRLNSCRVLDHGCGKGLLVEAGVSKSIDFYGVEMFSHGSGIGIKDEIACKGLLGNRIKEIVDHKIPFPDEYFDLVVSNQVLEHIPDIEPVISEIGRVLRADGLFLCIVPYQEAFMEGHCKIPFAHWFRAESAFQYYWLYVFKVLGFGRRKKEKDPRVWANYFSAWLKDNTFYRTFPEINGLFKKNFQRVEYIEDEYIKFRLLLRNNKYFSHFATQPVIKFFSRWFCRRFGSLVIVARKEIAQNIESRGVQRHAV